MNTNNSGRGLRGTQGRVAQIHSQTRRGLIVGFVFIVVAVIVGICSFSSSWWLPLHLFVVGGLLNAIFATTLMLAVTWSSSPPPPKIISSFGRWILSFGVIALAIGREYDQNLVLVAGGMAIIFSMLVLAALLIWIRKNAVTDRFAPAIETYVVAILAGAIGMSIGVVLGINGAGSIASELREIHFLFNLFGMIGLVIAGTLPYFLATQLRSKMSVRATSFAKRATLVVMVISILTSALGILSKTNWIQSTGLFIYAIGLVSVLAMLPFNKASRVRYLQPRVLQLIIGIIWWLAMVIALGITSLNDGGDQIVLQTMIVGGFAQILVGSLAYLAPVLRGGGHKLLSAGFATTHSWLSLLAGNFCAVVSLLDNHFLLVVGLVIWICDVALRAGKLIRQKAVVENE